MYKLLYVFDAYCGWCYGIARALRELEATGEVAIEVKHGSLFQGANQKTLGDFPHIPGANAKISELTGAQFGPAYEELLNDGSLLLDSHAAAVGINALKAAAGAENGGASGRDREIAAAMQTAFYMDGLSLSDPETYAKIAADLGLDAQAVAANLESPEILRIANEGQDWLQRLGVHSYPTLLLQLERGLMPIGSPTSSAEELLAEIRKHADA